MSEKIETARTIRIGAEALRKIATRETDPALAAELMRVAQEMDDHAAALEGAMTSGPPAVGDEALA